MLTFFSRCYFDVLTAQESLRLAKEAVALDVGSGSSWYVLGNAYVASFFRNSRGVKDLDRALQAYKKAVSALKNARKMNSWLIDEKYGKMGICIYQLR